MTTTTATVWPRQADVQKFFGEPGSPACTAGMAEVYPMRVDWARSSIVRRFRCHTKVEKPIEAIFAKTMAHYGEKRVAELGLDLFGGCYNFRPMRGGDSWSMHAWGIAVDLDPSRNQLKWGKDRAAFARPEYDAFWAIVESEGAVSLGRARNYDWMQFQFARP